MAPDGNAGLSRKRHVLRAAYFSLLWVTTLTMLAPARPTPAAGGLVPVPTQNAFTPRDAVRLLDQIGAGLVEHNRQKTLGAFDLARMTDGDLFAQQITSFLAHAGIIRVHYNGIEAGMEDTNSVASVDFEMDADPRDDNLPSVRKQARLRLMAENTAAGWKLIDVQPRSFFSFSQP